MIWDSIAASHKHRKHSSVMVRVADSSESNLGPWSSLNFFVSFFLLNLSIDENYEKTRLVLIFASDWLIMQDIYLQSHPSKSCFSSLSCRRDWLYHNFTCQKITINSPNSEGIDFCSVHIRDRLPLPFMIFWNKDWFVLTWVDVIR